VIPDLISRLRRRLVKGNYRRVERLFLALLMVVTSFVLPAFGITLNTS
jgi:hypothetical protein